MPLAPPFGVVSVAVYEPLGQPPLGGCSSRKVPVPVRETPGPVSVHWCRFGASSPSALRIEPRSGITPYCRIVALGRGLEIAATTLFGPSFTVSVPVDVIGGRLNWSVTATLNSHPACASEVSIVPDHCAVPVAVFTLSGLRPTKTTCRTPSSQSR